MDRKGWSRLIAACLLACAAGRAGAQSRDPADYTLIVETKAKIKNGAINGNVGLHDLPALLSLGRDTQMGQGTTVVARVVKLSPGADAWDVYANLLKVSRDATVVTQQTVMPPIYQTEPLFVPDPYDPANYPVGYPPTCGGPNRIPAPGESLVLPPGSYGTVMVRDEGRLTLLGGTYHICRLRVGGAAVEATAAAKIYIRDELSLLNGSLFTTATNVSPADVEIYYSGRVLGLGQNAGLHATVYAPGATLKLGRHAQLVGQFLVARVRSDHDISIEPPSPPSPGCGNGVLNGYETCDPPGIAVPPNNNICRSDCTFCGDGIVQATEECDDGNSVDADGCRNNCTIGPPSNCGNGVLNPGETCDPPGSDPPPAGGNLCRLDCTYCGDGVVQAGEQCDDANTNDGDGCRNDCTLPPPPSCGDGVVNGSETCDPPGSDPPPAGGNLCRTDCTYCGDGIVQPGEQCDDANTNNGDACRNDCTLPPGNACGNGVLNPGETCDPPGSDPPPPGGNLCRLNCTYCGDGIAQAGEQCDDGNSIDTDGCRNDCTLPPPPACGDGTVNGAETCDPPGSDPPPPGGNLCRTNCTYCGDGIVQAGEQCDDGNSIDADACRNDCTLPPSPTCGDGVVNQPSETCDPPGSDPPPAGGNLCRTNCTYCGDGIVQASEQCDDGNNVDTDGCRNDCTIPGVTTTTTSTTSTTTTTTLPLCACVLNPSFNLGEAANYSVLALANADVAFGTPDTGVIGNVGLAANTTGDLTKATIQGHLDVDPTSTATIAPDLIVTCGITTQDMTQPDADARSASAFLAAKAPSQTFGDITADTTITGSPGENVIAVSSIVLNGPSLTLVGGPTDTFIINVTGEVSFTGTSGVVLSGGIPFTNVIFNMPTAATSLTDTVSIKGNAVVANGIFLAPQRPIDLDKATLYGAIIGGDSTLDIVNVHSGAQLLGCPPCPACP